MNFDQGVVIWFTGRPAAGKTTLARAVCEHVRSLGHPACVLDSDEVRERMKPAPGYGEEARASFYATLAQFAAYLAAQGFWVLVAATAHRRAFRQYARGAAEIFVEVHVDTDVAICAQRDPKGLYRRAARGEIASLPGIDVAYEPPMQADVTAHGGVEPGGIDRIVNRTFDIIKRHRQGPAKGVIDTVNTKDTDGREH